MPADQPARPVADAAAFAARTGVDDLGFYAGLVAEVLTTARSVLEAGPDQEALDEAAHRLSGAAGSLALAPLALAARDVEHAARSHEADGADTGELDEREAWAAVRRETERLAAWLEEHSAPTP